MARRTAGWNSRAFVRGRLRAALYWNRKRQWKDGDDTPVIKKGVTSNGVQATHNGTPVENNN